MTRDQALTMLTTAQNAGQIDASVNLQDLTTTVFPLIQDAENAQIERRADVARQNALIGSPDRGGVIHVFDHE
jgi:hypothetical protein